MILTCKITVYGSGPITDEQKKQLEIALKMIFYEHYKGDDK